MEMQQVRYFLALSRTLNFSRAAEECNVTQPALSRAIQSLEAELGGELIYRERHQSHLTELGKRMLPFMSQCYDAAVSAKSLAKADASDTALLSVAISNSINIALFVWAFSELFRAYPGIQCKIRRGTPLEIVELLKRGEADLGIAGPIGEAWDRLDTWRLFAEGIEVIVNSQHRLARSNDPEISVEDLIGEPILNRVEWETAEELTRLLSENGVELSRAHEVENDHDLLALLEANAGVGFATITGPTSSRVRRMTIKGLNLRRVVAVYGVAGRVRSPVATSFLNLARATDWSHFDVDAPA